MTKRSYIRIVIVIVILCGLLGTGIAAFLFSRNPGPSTASSSIEFTFAGSAESIAPNGTRYNPEDMRNDDILRQALVTAGLDSRYTPEQVRTSLKVSGVYPADFIDQVKSFRSLLDFQSSSGNILSNYHSTQFSVVLTNDFDKSIDASSQKSLLDAILTAYVSYFRQTFGSYLDTGFYENLFAGTEADLIHQLEAIDQEIANLSLYAEEMTERAPDLKLGGRGFDDINIRLQNLSDSTVSQLKANLQVNALAKNPQRLLNQYESTLQRLSLQLEAQKQHLESLDRLIASFERNGTIYLSTTVSTTALDGNSSLTYDKLIETRSKLTEKITSTSKQVATYQEWIANLAREDQSESADADPFSTDEVEAVDALSESQISTFQLQINSIRETLGQIVTDFKALLTAYNDEQINEDTVAVTAIRYEAPSLISLNFVKKAIKTSAPFCAAGFILCIILLLPKMKQRHLQHS
ncbi:MAG: hypothetical protein IJ088_03255 [Clostridia bacterium]|nr:hypothetical protein [Clostridia bacterium]